MAILGGKLVFVQIMNINVGKNVMYEQLSCWYLSLKFKILYYL